MKLATFFSSSTTRMRMRDGRIRRRQDSEGAAARRGAHPGERAPRSVLEVALQLLPERLFGRLLAVLDQCADRLAELVERDRPDRCLALRALVAVDPVGDLVLVVGVEREELLAGDLVHLLALARRARRPGADEPAEHHACGHEPDDPTCSHAILLEVLVAAQ